MTEDSPPLSGTGGPVMSRATATTMHPRLCRLMNLTILTAAALSWPDVP